MEIITTPPRRALAVTPHPDDCEGGCGATLGRWIKEAGTEVAVVLCTNGDKGTSDREMSSARLAAIREREQQEASDVLGVKEVAFLAHPDGGLEDTMLFRSQLVREIRRHKPDVILCIDPYRSNSHTHRDHRMSGQVALDAAFSYAWSHLHFLEQIYAEGLEPHRVAEAYLWGSEAPDVFVDVADYLELKAESLGKHASQMSGRDLSARIKRVSERAEIHAETSGLPFTEGFRRIQFDLGSMASQFMNS
ncbi:MAG: PIG-L deacetylase family protein [Dehalococcoidia bacterium]|nr:PIG-L deacetylase family protein [Dehalococcoidia bacterium]